MEEKKRSGSRTYTVHMKHFLKGKPGETAVVNEHQTHRQVKSLLDDMQSIWKNTSAVIERTHSFLSISADLIVIQIWFELER